MPILLVSDPDLNPVSNVRIRIRPKRSGSNRFRIRIRNTGNPTDKHVAHCVPHAAHQHRSAQQGEFAPRSVQISTECVFPPGTFEANEHKHNLCQIALVANLGHVGLTLYKKIQQSTIAGKIKDIKKIPCLRKQQYIFICIYAT
jgi:hypothetical protein